MPYRSWLYAIALGVALPAYPSWPQNVENPSEPEIGAAESDAEAESSEQSSIDITPALNGIEAAIRELIADEDKAEKERREDQQSRDLQAQEDMAVWAGKMFWATVATAALTLFGLILIGKTLRYTRIAADHTEEMLAEAKETTNAANLAAKAAEVANTHAAKFAEMDTRAYLTASDVSLIASDNENGIFVEVTIRNVGKSPAYNVTAVRFCICEAAQNLGEPISGIPEIGPERTLVAVLAPGADAICSFPIFLNHAVDSSLVERPGEKVECVEVMIAYQSIYDVTRKQFSGDLGLAIELHDDLIEEVSLSEKVKIDHFSAGHRSGWMDYYLKERLQKDYDRRAWDYRPPNPMA